MRVGRREEEKVCVFAHLDVCVIYYYENDYNPIHIREVVLLFACEALSAITFFGGTRAPKSPPGLCARLRARSLHRCCGRVFYTFNSAPCVLCILIIYVHAHYA